MNLQGERGSPERSAKTVRIDVAGLRHRLGLRGRKAERPDGDLHHLIRAMPAKGAHLAGSQLCSTAMAYALRPWPSC